MQDKNSCENIKKFLRREKNSFVTKQRKHFLGIMNHVFGEVGLKDSAVFSTPRKLYRSVNK